MRNQLFWTDRNITEFSGTIVNAANADLRKGSGVCGAIHAAAGPQLEQDCIAIRTKRRKQIPTGSSVLTSGHNCKAQFVVHAVGPIYSQYGEADAIQLLAKTYLSAMNHAMMDKYIVFPAISCGVYGFPIPMACKVAVNTLQHWIYMHPDFYGKIILTAFDPAVAIEYSMKLNVDKLHDRDIV